jgi:predicted DNA binding CopG/RHH family protein
MKRAAATPQLHIRVSPDLKKAVKMLCARDGTTAQSWINTLIENELHHKAPDLWTPGNKEGEEAQE